MAVDMNIMVPENGEGTGTEVTEVDFGNAVDMSWTGGLCFEDARDIVKEKLVNSVAEFVAAGFFLKFIRDARLYVSAGYASIWECAEKEFGLKETSASRCMSFNDKYSIDGNSIQMQEQYRNYSKSQLQEMLYLTDEQIRQVSPDMTVKEMREIRRPEPRTEEQVPGQMNIEEYPGIVPTVATSQDSVCTQDEAVFEEEIYEETDMPEEEGLSAYGLPKTEYPAGSLIMLEGCGNEYCCFACAMDCGIRQKDRDCVLAPMGAPFHCETMNVMDMLKEELGEKCQFVNHDIAEHSAGSKEASPCCRRCNEICGYRCKQSCRYGEEENKEKNRDETPENVNAVQDEIFEETDMPEEPVSETAVYEEEWQDSEEPVSDFVFVKNLLRKETDLLAEYLRFGDLPEDTVRRQRMIVIALVDMSRELEKEQYRQEKQPELPELKNDDARKEFINSYRSWPLWIDMPLTGERYYRYDLANGSSFVVKTYLYKAFNPDSRAENWEDRYMDSWGCEEYYLLAEGKHFKDCLASRSTLVNFLRAGAGRGSL